MSTATIDPMDQPEPEESIYRYLQSVETRVRAENPSLLDWSQIQADAQAEFTSRITEFHDSKNSAMVDWMLDNRERFMDTLPTTLMAQTGTKNKKNHELAKDLSPEEARVIVREARGL